MHIQPCSHIRPAAARPMPGRHVLLVIQDQRTRYALADMLLDAEFRLTLATNANMADTLLESAAGFDLLVVESSGLPSGLARVAQTACPGLPVLLLDDGAASGPGVLDAAVDAMERWPVLAH